VAAIRSDFKPALAGSVLLHAGVIGLAFLALKLSPPIKPPPPPVPITIVSEAPGSHAATPASPAPSSEPAPAPDPSPAPVKSKAPEAEPPPIPAPHHARPKPAEIAKPEPLPPPPKPEPKPAAHRAKHEPAKLVAVPKPNPVPKPIAQAKPKPEDLNLDALASSLPATRAQKRATRDLDLSALASSLPRSKAAKVARNDLDLSALAATLPVGARHANAPQARATVARASSGPVSLTGAELGALRDKLIQLWNPNCGVEGAGKVIVRVEMKLSPDGRLAGAPRVVSQTAEGVDDEVVEASARRALTAVNRGEPYSELPKDKYAAWKDIVVRFNAKEACSGR
jgi:colicin import membrane protein